MIKRNLIANFLGQAWVSLMGLAFVPQYIKYLGIEAYGLIGIYVVLQTWFTILDMGMTPTLNREIARYTAGAHSAETICDLLRTFELIACTISLVIVFSVAIASGWIANDWLNIGTLEVSEVKGALLLIGVVVALRFIEGLYRGAVLGFQRHVWLNMVSAGMATLRGGGAVLILISVGSTIQNFFMWQAFVSLLTVLLFHIDVKSNLPKILRSAKFNPNAFVDAWKFASGMFYTTLLALILTQVDKIMLSRMLTLEEFGGYMFATTVAGILFQIIGPIAQAYYPRLTELVSRGDTLVVATTYHQGAQLMTSLLVPAGLALIFYPNILLFAWTSNAELSAQVGPLIAVLAAGIIFNGLMHIPYMLQLANGWTALAVGLNIVAVIIVVPLLFVILPKFGPIGAAFIWFFINCGYVIVSAHLMHVRLLQGHKWKWYFSDILLPSLAALGVYVLIDTIKPELIGMWMNVIWVFIVAFFAVVASFLCSSELKARVNKLNIKTYFE
jgi:O-antigen/teichoic acid export membrane protein